MKHLRFRPLIVTLSFAAPALAHAHPGHDGDHDFVWDFDHFAAHPLATIACVTVLGAAIWGIRLLIRSRSAKAVSLSRDQR